MKLKQKLLAVITALALTFSMAGCNISTPETVGSIGDIEITAGIYLISQFQAYQTVLGYASTEQSSMSVSNFLKETVYIAEDGTMAPEPEEGEEQTGEARSVADFIESETLANLEYYAAIETMFAALGGELTDEEIEYAESYAEQLWEYYGDLYEANGIGESTLLAYQYTNMKQSALLDLIYGTDGTEAVSDDDLTAYLQDEMYYGTYLSVPFYNTSDYTFADTDQQTEIVEALLVCAAAFEESMTEADDADAIDAFVAALEENVTAAYDVMESTFDTSTVADSIVSDLYGYSTLESYFDEDVLTAIAALDMNEATAFYADYTSAMIFMRCDPLTQGYTLDDLRTTILTEMMSDALITLTEETGAALTNNLDADAMAELPAKKVVAE